MLGTLSNVLKIVFFLKLTGRNLMCVAKGVILVWGGLLVHLLQSRQRETVAETVTFSRFLRKLGFLFRHDCEVGQEEEELVLAFPVLPKWGQ